MCIAAGEAVSFADMVTSKKVIVNIPNLLKLAQQKCHMSGCSEPIVHCVPIVQGCSLKLEMTCSAKHFMEWYSCPSITSKGGGCVVVTFQSTS